MGSGRVVLVTLSENESCFVGILELNKLDSNEKEYNRFVLKEAKPSFIKWLELELGGLTAIEAMVFTDSAFELFLSQGKKWAAKCQLFFT